MSTPNASPTPILIASDNAADAAQVARQLGEEFDQVFTSVDPDAAVPDFERRKPGVLVLAFNSLEKAERYYLGLYRLCATVQQHPHRTVILCIKDEVKRVCELCKKRYFDDYVLYWPMTYDMSRLGMSVYNAVRDLAKHTGAGPSAVEFAAQARRLGELEGVLEQQLAQGSRHMAVASRAMAQAEQDIASSLDGFSQRVIGAAGPDSVLVKDAQAFQQELERLKRDEVGKHLRVATASVVPAKAWADGFKQALAPQLASARALNEMAERVRGTVLMVDDDGLQRKLVAKILAGENCDLVFAASGMEALSQLRTTRPDLILMDVQMPLMDGIETTQRLKAAPGLASIPVLMISGQSGKNTVAESIKAGAAGFVVKPFVRDTLIARVRQALHGT